MTDQRELARLREIERLARAWCEATTALGISIASADKCFAAADALRTALGFQARR
jgi:hypothetical protein